ncbi:MAG: DUF3300 domain-containing protein [Verrucomicrobiota bacterium]|jgi:hypothetical protein
MTCSNKNILLKLLLKIPVLICLFTAAAVPVRAQVAAPPPMAAYQPLPAAQLDQLLGPIALYPDPLIAEILPASTLPTQIVLADRYVSGGGDPNQIGQQPWDPGVQAMARYPSVLKWMDDNLNWTAQVGQAFLNQQPDVMASIQRLRAEASKLGNLQSSPQQQVIADGSDIEIVPADPQVIYVPVYQPDQVYFDAADGSPFITFGIGWPFGAWMGYDCNWGGGNLIFWGNGFSRPANWWRESSRQRDMSHAGVWRANSHPGAGAANRGDRGYGGNTLSRVATPAAIRQELAHPAAQPVERSGSVSRSGPAPVQRSAPVSRSESTGAFIGIQSSQETRTYSNRGQLSMQAVTHSAPVSRSAPSGGGGGFSGGGSHGGGGGGKR